MFGMFFIYIKKQNWCRNFTENVPNVHSTTFHAQNPSGKAAQNPHQGPHLKMEFGHLQYIFQSVGANSQQYLKFYTP